jgi:hypothetical protein
VPFGFVLLRFQWQGNLRGNVLSTRPSRWRSFAAALTYVLTVLRRLRLRHKTSAWASGDPPEADAWRHAWGDGAHCEEGMRRRRGCYVLARGGARASAKRGGGGGFLASSEATANRAAARSSVGSVKIK